MRKMFKSSTLVAAAILTGAVNVASATELEVTHWWTSGGEANAVGELAKLLMQLVTNGLMVLLLVQVVLQDLLLLVELLVESQWVLLSLIMVVKRKS